MNKFKDLFNQVKVRKFPDKNYHAIWNNLKTVRLGRGVAKELNPDRSEFYDVGINTKCNAECKFCYVGASSKGVDYEGICETWNKWMKTFPEDKVIEGTNIISTEKPFQIAIGSTGEPTVSLQFCKFLQTVYESGVVPNYTTNGMILFYWDKPGSKYYSKANEILSYTSLYCGGVAVSFGNKALRKYATGAIKGLLEKGRCKVNIHHIISDKQSVDEFFEIYNSYLIDNPNYCTDTTDINKFDDRKKVSLIHNHVLLPLMKHGRSDHGLDEGTWEYLESKLLEETYDDVSFGAHFIKYLENSKIKTWLYPAESLSKNIILEKDCVKITPSSFDLNPIKEIIL